MKRFYTRIVLLLCTLAASGCSVSKMLFPAGMAFLLVVGLGLGGCSQMQSAQVASVAAQVSGAVAGLADVATALPVDDATKQQIAGYATWAKLGADAVSGVSTALAGPDAVSQTTGSVTAIADLVQRAPVDDATKATVGGWASWAMIAARAAATILPLVL
jgi:hypothetical protein